MTANPRRLVIRADATSQVGAGHVMRCATLANAWQRLGYGSALFVGRIEQPFVQARLRRLGIEWSDQDVAIDADAVLVTDVYDETERRRAAQLPVTCRMLVDDLGTTATDGYAAVWSPNAYGTRHFYNGFDGIVFTGPLAVPIREDLPTWTGGNELTVGVTLGGGRPDDHLVAALTECARADRVNNYVGVGDWLPPGWERASGDSMWDRFRHCARLLTAGGTTVWEAAAVGIVGAVVQTAKNQEGIATWAAHVGVPVVRASELKDVAALAHALGQAIGDARALPRLSNGAPSVASELAALANRG